MTPQAIRDLVRQRCVDAGACAVGFAACGPVDDAGRTLYRRWIADGRHASMEYMERYCEVRDNPALLLEGAATIVSCAFAYTSPDTPRHPLFADYALGRDYHTVLRKALGPVVETMQAIVTDSSTRICVDTARIRERYWAQKAGVGFVGLNNQLIVPGVGSAVFLAEILWTEPLPPDVPLDRCCTRCGACVRACPGHALDGKGGLDARGCLSYLTIEHRGELPEGTRLPARIYGCDICRDVCPMARPSAPVRVLPDFAPSSSLMALDAEAILSLDAPAFSALFSKSAVRRVKLEGLRRNALRHKATE